MERRTEADHHFKRPDMTRLKTMKEEWLYQIPLIKPENGRSTNNTKMQEQQASEMNNGGGTNLR